MKLLLPLTATFAIATTTSAVPNHGLDFVTVGDPGNPDFPVEQQHPLIQVSFGAVDYEYRLTRTELTYTDQLEFLNAYNPYIQESDSHSWGDISRVAGTWQLRKGSENRPGEMSPRLWMRYANRLHNDKALTQDAFESGAYDTTTFGRDEDGNLTDQFTRSPGAKFWIPSLDEWTKGGYYDPNRYGEGEGGYWLFPNQSDTPSIPGHPDDGGETNAGFGDYPLDAGSYPDTQTPWGLLDYSGGGGFEVAERFTALSTNYFALGSRAGISDIDDERLGWVFFSGATLGGNSLRLASAVPTPGASVFLVAGISALTRRRR